MSGMFVFLSQFYVNFRKVTLVTGVPFKYMEGVFHFKSWNLNAPGDGTQWGLLSEFYGIYAYLATIPIFYFQNLQESGHPDFQEFQAVNIPV